MTNITPEAAIHETNSKIDYKTHEDSIFSRSGHTLINDIREAYHREMQPSFFSIPLASDFIYYYVSGIKIFYYFLLKDSRPILFLPFFRRPPSPLSVVRLVVSTDGEQYTVVDVTGAPDGAWIRQRIFAKVGGTVLYCKRNLGPFC